MFKNLFFFNDSLLYFYNLFIFNDLNSSLFYYIINLNISYYGYFYYHYILIILILYTTINNWYLLMELKFFIIYIKINLFIFFKNIGSFFYEHLNYCAMVSTKSIFINLLIRLIEINKEKERYPYRKIYIASQFIDFFYIKIMLNYFYALFSRFIYFNVFFFLKNIYLFLLSLFYKYLINLNIYIYYMYFFYRLKIIFLFLGDKFLLKIYNFIYYIKLEFFIYFINENNFFGGLILYVYNYFCFNISSFNNLKDWEFNRLNSSNYIKNKFDKWNLNLNFIYKSNNIKKIQIFFLFFITYVRLFISKIRIKKLYINIFFLKKNIFIYNFFILLGFYIFLLYDVMLNLIFFFFYILKFIIIRIKLVIFIYLLYKLGLYNILCSFIIYHIHDTIEYNIYIYLHYIIFLYYNYMEIINFYLYNSTFNENLINLWISEYNIILKNRYVYFNNTFLSKILYLLEFDFNNLSKWYNKKELIIKDAYTLKKRIKEYFSSFFKSIFNEFFMYYIIIKDYIIYKFINIYTLYIYKFSDLNLYYYVSKKIIYYFYLIYIYIRSYFKFLYFYILPYYNIIPRYFLYYYFVKFWFIYIYLNYGFLYFIIILNYIYNLIIIYIYILINILKNIVNHFFYFGFFFFLCIFDLFYIINIKISIIFLNIYEVFIYFFFKFKLILYYKEILLNYLRLNILNLINYKKNNYIILGNKVEGIIIYNLDALDFEKIKKYKLASLKELRSFQTLGPIMKKYNDYNLYSSDIYFFNNMYTYYFFNNLYFYNYFIYKIFLYYYTNYIIFVYFFIIFFFGNKLKNNLNYNYFLKNNYNLNYLWNDFRLNIKYNLINNDKLFLKALDFNRKKIGKKKIIDNIYLLLNYYKDNFKNFRLNKFNNIINNKINNKINYMDLNCIYYNKYNNINIRLNNFFIEKFMYSNNFYFFYWKNFILKNNSYNYYLSSHYLEFLKFFLSLIFRKNKLAPKIYYYLNNYRQIYFFNNINLNYFKTVDLYIYRYYNYLDNLFKLNKFDWTLNKDKYIIWFKDEDAQFNNIYSLNFNISFPKFIFEYFWIGFIIYIFFFRFNWRYSTFLNIFSAYINFFYIKLTLFNNNFLYLYDVYIYWLNSFLIFDRKNVSYEHNDYLLFNREMSKMMPKHSSSNIFVINNDPLFYLKKYYVYSLFNNKNKYNLIYITNNIYIYKYIICIINYIIYIYILYIIKFYQKNYKKFKLLDIIIFINNYKNNNLNFLSYIKKFFLN